LRITSFVEIKFGTIWNEGDLTEGLPAEMVDRPRVKVLEIMGAIRVAA